LSVISFLPGPREAPLPEIFQPTVSDGVVPILLAAGAHHAEEVFYHYSAIFSRTAAAQRRRPAEPDSR
jgi:hypothetical protein